MRWIVSLLVNSVVLIAVSGLLKGIAPDAFYVANIQTAIIAAICISIFNMIIEKAIVEPLYEKKRK